MTGTDGDSADTKTAIMEATYRALCDHGYADLTIKDIAAEFEKSRSLLFYHYESKDELLVDFLGFVLDQFADEIDMGDDAGPTEQLYGLLERVVPEDLESDERDFHVAFFELRSQAPSNERFRQQFTKTDEFLFETVAAYLTAGIEAGTFRDVDVDETTGTLMTMIYGTIFLRVSCEDEALVGAMREGLYSYVRSLEQ